MPNPLQSPGSNGLGLLAIRLPMGILFCATGYNKLSKSGIDKFVASYVKEVPSYMPDWFPRYYLSALPFAEMVLGAFIIVGMLTRISGFLASCLVISFLMYTGIHDASAYQLPFHPNFFFLGITLLLFFTGGGKYSVDSRLFNAGGK